MSSVKEHRLHEIELASIDEAREALCCVLHTILFCRAPGPFKPQTVYAAHFELAYSRVGCTSIKRSVERAVDGLLASNALVAAGPELVKGALVLSFFDRRRSRSLFGLVGREEKIVWEQWTLPVLISTKTRPLGDDEAAELERRRHRAESDAVVRRRLADVHALVNGPLDHVPSSMYEFEIVQRTSKGEPRDGVYTRVMLNPPLHLGAL
ncbi:hypothetical protein M885DRAFT_513625 [Pelagophyceae sp. CCMP2097]|nr:hypothetical protein M885DRAFT_513625 [Pelagophyceae sp. CCMP2097]